MRVVNERRFDVLTVGEGLVRLSVNEGGVLETANQLDVFVGGAEANVAVALARMGRKVAWMSRVADDPFGRRVVAELRRHGVNCEAIVWQANSRTGVYYAEIAGPPRGVSVTYDRSNSAATQMSSGNTDVALVADARVVQLSGITPALSDSCAEMSHSLLKTAKIKSCKVLVDVNYRSRLWTIDKAKSVLGPLCAMADLVLCTAEDARDLFGIAEPSELTAAQLAEKFGVPTVVLTDGPHCVYWHDREGSGFSPAILTTTVDRIGAGDAFCAGVIIGLLDGDLVSGIRTGQAMASLKHTIAGDQLVSSAGEVAAVLATGTRSVKR